MNVDNFSFFVIAGFVAQLIDGTLGMAYGVCCNSLLLSTGVAPVVASASVHLAELFTTGFSGFCHWRLGNIDLVIFKKLLLPGVVGGISGAYILTSIPGERIKPLVSFYLLAMGLYILYKAFRKGIPVPSNRQLAPLGFIGGLVDAIGGGGWGPIVTSSLVARGNAPRLAIGSVNLAEFFVTVATSATFTLAMGLIHWRIIAGLVVGGLLAAPLAAFTCRHLRPKPLMVLVGLLIVGLSIRTLYQSPIKIALIHPIVTQTSQTIWR